MSARAVEHAPWRSGTHFGRRPGCRFCRVPARREECRISSGAKYALDYKRWQLGIVSTNFANVHEPTPIEMQTLQRYGMVAAEYGYVLLDESYPSLAVKAEQMSAQLFARTLD
jgi:hypothetical protein